ncbi:hypothetical protein [Caulobacter radicis]|uniref:hypothetical protein n=1 Tax=Caulobacter radicis TaxID=2172650 RepID=UPI0010581B62|nr:hypothetical protein [Caulobacter radicis]
MRKYFKNIENCSNLNYKSGSSIVVAHDFYVLSAIVVSKCSFIQDQIQQIIYRTHGRELLGAKRALKNFPNPKSRVDFLCSYPYSNNDNTIKIVFDYVRTIFSNLYELRNILSHEVWFSSDDFPSKVLFHTLDENSKLLMAQGKIWHDEDAGAQYTYDAIIKFIKSVKVIDKFDLEMSIKDIDVCSWSLMIISGILDCDDEERREAARQSFLVFRGTSHLFDEAPASPGGVEFSSSRNKTINQ